MASEATMSVTCATFATWLELLATFATWLELLATFATWLELLATFAALVVWIRFTSLQNAGLVRINSQKYARLFFDSFLEKLAGYFKESALWTRANVLSVNGMLFVLRSPHFAFWSQPKLELPPS
jgi:hypothetical protein